MMMKQQILPKLHRISEHYEVALQSTLYDGYPEPKNLQEAKQSKEWLYRWKDVSTEFDNMHSK
jgi:hypothetical protein